jgi:hypothetical protein
MATSTGGSKRQKHRSRRKRLKLSVFEEEAIKASGRFRYTSSSVDAAELRGSGRARGGKCAVAARLRRPKMMTAFSLRPI